MALFSQIFFQLIPLFSFIFLGGILQKTYPLDRGTLSHLLFYCFTPSLVLLGMLKADLTYSVLTIPLVSYLLLCLSSLGVLLFLRPFFSKGKRSLLAFGAASGNIGFFGIPVLTSLLGDEVLPTALLGVFGLILFENTFGFYFFARHEFSPKKVIQKIIFLPSMWMFFIGILWNISGVPYSGIEEILILMKGGYTVLGMMLIGISLANIRIHHISPLFLGVGIALRHILVPLFVYGVLSFLLTFSFFSYTPFFREVLFLQSICPVAANIVILSTLFRTEEEMASLFLFVSTLLSLITFPVIASLVL